jgi:hypothetical protein
VLWEKALGRLLAPVKIEPWEQIEGLSDRATVAHQATGYNKKLRLERRGSSFSNRRWKQATSSKGGGTSERIQACSRCLDGISREGKGLGNDRRPCDPNGTKAWCK